MPRGLAHIAYEASAPCIVHRSVHSKQQEANGNSPSHQEKLDLHVRNYASRIQRRHAEREHESARPGDQSSTSGLKTSAMMDLRPQTEEAHSNVETIEDDDERRRPND